MGRCVTDVLTYQNISFFDSLIFTVKLKHTITWPFLWYLCHGELVHLFWDGWLTGKNYS